MSVNKKQHKIYNFFKTRFHQIMAGVKLTVREDGLTLLIFLPPYSNY